MWVRIQIDGYGWDQGLEDGVLIISLGNQIIYSSTRFVISHGFQDRADTSKNVYIVLPDGGMLYYVTFCFDRTKLPVLYSPYNLLLPPGLDVRSVFPDGHFISSRHVGRCGSGWIDLPCPLQSVCERHAPPSHHVELALYVDDAAIIATSRKTTLLVSYLESFLNDLQGWLSEWRIAINVSRITAIIFARAGRRLIQPQPFRLLGEPNEWFDTIRYLGVNLDKGLNCSPNIDKVRKRPLRRWTCWVPSWTGSDLSVRNGVLLYKQFIRSMMDYVCPAWRSTARSHVWRLRVLQSMCFGLATGAPWYVSNRKIHEVLGVPSLPITSEPWMRALTQR